MTFEWLKLPSMLELLRARYLFVLCFALGLVLFGPQYLRGKLGLADFLESYRAWVGVIFLVSSMLWLVKIGEWISKGIFQQCQTP